MEDYKEKYEMALERAKEELGSGCFNRGSIEYIFPELKKESESEDEQIRKELISFVRNDGWKFIKLTKEEKKSWIAWLEKHVSPDMVADAYLRGCNDTEEKLLEKQNEQKSVDKVEPKKVEPKFKVGDWVLYSGDHYEGVRHITKIDENGYYIERNGLPHGIIPFNHEICMRLWTIDDAKPGDILSNGNMILIFKQFEIPDYKQHIIAYIGLDTFGNIQVTSEHWTLGIDKAKPATKEQRDLLFKKMNEAGYTWDAEKKELKKCINPKFKVGEWIASFDSEYVGYIKSISEIKYEILLTNGNYDYMLIDYIDENFHLWTIRDAKPGDILAECSIKIETFEASEVGTYLPFVAIFKERNLAFPDDFDTYCFVSYSGEFYEGDNGHDSSGIHPASKKQREWLFLKMKESGYEWDAEKKQLIQINEDNEEYNDEDYGIDGLYHAQAILERTLGEVDGYQSDDGMLEHKCAINAVKRLYKKKIYWNKEDEENMNILIDCVSQLEERDINDADLMKRYNTVISWLEKIKERLK